MMGLSLGFSALLLARVITGGEAVVLQVGGWRFPYGISLVGDPLSALFVVMSQLVLCAGLIYARGSKDAIIRYPPFYTLFLLLATGLTGAFLTGDLFNLFVFAELLVFSGAILTANSDDPYGAEAALKYFFMSFVASAALLLANRYLLSQFETPPQVDGSVIIPPAFVSPTARITRSVIGPNVSIGDNVMVEDAVIRDSIVDIGATIESAMLTGSIIGRDALVRGEPMRVNVGDSSSIDLRAQGEHNRG